MTTDELLNRAGSIAFAMDLTNEPIADIVEAINIQLGATLRELYNGDGTNPPKFNSDMVNSLLAYEDLRYMMSTARRPTDEDGPMSIEDAINFNKE